MLKGSHALFTQDKMIGAVYALIAMFDNWNLEVPSLVLEGLEPKYNQHNVPVQNMQPRIKNVQKCSRIRIILTPPSRRLRLLITQDQP